MDGKIWEKLSLSKIKLWSINAYQKNKVETKTYTAYLTIEPELEEDSEKWLDFFCKIDLSFGEDGPFNFNLKYKVRFKKNEKIDWKTVEDFFEVVSQPVLAEASKLIANICSDMGFPPLILSPREMAQVIKSDNREDNNSEYD